MPMIDVSELLTDVDFADKFDVLRRAEVISVLGVSQVTTTTLKNQIGVVTAGSPNRLERLDTVDYMPRIINVVTRVQLRGPAAGGKPDVVVWRGDNYVVSQIEPYPQFGRGFVQARCESMDAVDVTY